jgi:hypothetical protein
VKKIRAKPLVASFVSKRNNADKKPAVACLCKSVSNMDLTDELKNIVDQVTVSKLPTINWFTSSMMLYVTGDNPEQLQAYHDGMRTECYQMRG